MVFILERTVVSRKTISMKNLFTISTLASTLMFSPISFAEWTKIGESRDGFWYVDFGEIRKQGGYVYYWTLLDYFQPTEFGDLSGKIYAQGDCDKFQALILSDSFHQEPMGKGRGVVNNETHKEWTYPAPNSAFADILETVCNR